jgi:hypothetical protein
MKTCQRHETGRLRKEENKVDVKKQGLGEGCESRGGSKRI